MDPGNYVYSLEGAFGATQAAGNRAQHPQEMQSTFAVAGSPSIGRNHVERTSSRRSGSKFSPRQAQQIFCDKKAPTGSDRKRWHVEMESGNTYSPEFKVASLEEPEKSL